VAVCDAVISGDDEVDELYLDVERRILGLFALQTPVASDLRLLTALLHINLHLERIADQAVNMAKIPKLADGLPQSPKVLQHLEEMGALALGMVGAAMDALARRDLELAHELPRMDDPIDRLNRGMLQQVLEVSEDKQMLGVGDPDVCRVAADRADRRQRGGHRRAGGVPCHRGVPRVHLASGDRTSRAAGARRVADLRITTQRR
jgi:hypothetical protein